MHVDRTEQISRSPPLNHIYPHSTRLLNMPGELEARSQFLTNAAHLVTATSPAAASFLGQARNRLLEDMEIDISERQRAAHRREFCGACGNLMIPGWSCKVSNVRQMGSFEPKDKAGKRRPRAVESIVVYTCLRCSRQTSQAQQRQPRRSMKVSKHAPSLAPALSGALPTRVDQEKLLKTTNASSKQRQKARKGGLQAMLEKNKAQQSSKGGLDLLDFAM